MRTAFLITAATKKIPPIGYYNWISKNEPSRKQLEQMLREISKELNETWVIKYTDFDQDPGHSKIYVYMLDDEKCVISVERRPVIEFPK